MTALSIDLALPAFPEIRKSFDLSPDSTEVSALITFFFLGLAVGQLVFGPLSDRFGRKPTLMAGMTVFVAGAVLAALMPTLPGVLIGRALWGFGAAAPRSVSVAMVRDSQQGHRWPERCRWRWPSS